MDTAGLSKGARPAALCRSLPGSASAAARRAAARLDDAVPQPCLDRTVADGCAREGVKSSAVATNHRHCEELLRRSNPGCCHGKQSGLLRYARNDEDTQASHRRQLPVQRVVAAGRDAPGERPSHRTATHGVELVLRHEGGERTADAAEEGFMRRL